mmetsp:Transcript_11496/g.13065  ORF Transcript_11496/g.13065 Transcript_11496/m.13065 type:complete len:105 (-) Transcript_11496:211-525(-)
MFEEGKLQPVNHKEIHTHEQFLETFLHFFKEGASSERIAVNQTLVHDILAQMNEKGIQYYSEVGGHAAKFAKRIVNENCKSFFPGMFTSNIGNKLKEDNINIHD